MWRDPSPLYPVDAEQRAGGTPPSSSATSALLGDRPAPADAAVPPVASAPPSTCATFGCEIAATEALTGYCAAHHDGWLTAAQEYYAAVDAGEQW